MHDPAVKDALIAAGGCDHTPDPTHACDTCARPAASWAKPQIVTAYQWSAVTIDGEIIDKRDVLSMSNLPLDRVHRLMVRTDDPRLPVIKVGVDPRKGERLFMFTRHSVKLNSGGVKIAVPVIEVKREQDEDFRVRLYLHPDGPILSTEDLYF